MKHIWFNGIAGGAYGWTADTPYAFQVWQQASGKYAWHVWKSPAHLPEKLPDAFGEDADSVGEAKQFAQMAVEELMERNGGSNG